MNHDYAHCLDYSPDCPKECFIGNDEDEDWYKCLFWTGCGVTILSYPKRQFKRTGKHYDIDKILEAMKE